MKKTKQMGDWLEVLQRHVASRTERVPPDWLRLKDVAKLFKRSERVTSSLLRELENSGLSERKRFNIVSSDGDIQSVWHFRLKK